MRYEAIARWLGPATKFDPALLGGKALEHLVEDRMRRAGTPDEAAYLALLQRDEQELERVLEGVAVPETSFFRYPASYELLAGWLARRRRGGAGELRMLSIACATGEEPCSMAITAAHGGWELDRVRIDAIDRSGRALRRARTGRYPVASLGPGVPEWARASFEVDDRHVQVRPALLGCIRYRRADATDLPPAVPPYDVIFCRNLLIYLSGAARRTLTAWLARSLAPGGRLFLGHAEWGAGLDRALVPVDATQAFACALAPVAGDPPGTRVATHGDRFGESAPDPGRSPTRPAIVSRGAPARAGDRRPARPETRGGGRERGRSAPTLAAARAIADRGDLQPAIDMARAVVELDGPSPDLLELLGSAHLALGELEQAHDCFFRAVYLDPAHEASLLQLALICERLGDAAQASRYRHRAERASARSAAIRLP